jgi:hypothetical protein
MELLGIEQADKDQGTGEMKMEGDLGVVLSQPPLLLHLHSTTAVVATLEWSVLF